MRPHAPSWRGLAEETERKILRDYALRVFGGTDGMTKVR
jgi:hypothetical protein